VRPYEHAAKLFDTSGDSRAVPESVMVYWLAEQLGCLPRDVWAMSVTDVWGTMGYLRGKAIALSQEDTARG